LSEIDKSRTIFQRPIDEAQNNIQQKDLFGGEDLSQVDKDLIFEGLKNLYKKKVLPLEIASKYSHFSSPPMGPSDFDAKPMVLILGQYSVGKTSFIRSLLQQDFPGQRIGPGLPYLIFHVHTIVTFEYLMIIQSLPRTASLRSCTPPRLVKRAVAKLPATLW